MPLLILITQDPSHPLAYYAIRFAEAALKSGAEVQTFFYANGANTANRLRWQSAEQKNLIHDWQTLADTYQLDLTVCVSTALARGVTDTENAQRHELNSDNLAKGFRLVGLSELVLKMNTHKLIQF